MAESPSKFYEIVGRDIIYDSLFGFCSPATIFRVGRTCLLARRATKDYTSRAFSINKHLSRFFSDPFAFRALQARTQAVVSGSNALQFMNRTEYPKADLDLYVTTRHAAEVCHWIVHHGGKGYTLVPSFLRATRGLLTVPAALLAAYRETGRIRLDIDDQASLRNFYNIKHIKQILNFRSLDGENRVIQVIITQNTAMECILCFHSTVVMNAITYCAAYSFYPKGTFEEGLMLLCDVREVENDIGIRKYVERGWKLANSVAPPFADPKKHAFVYGKHRVGDSSTWVIPFDDVSRILQQTELPIDYLPRTDPLTLYTLTLALNARRGLEEMQYAIVGPRFFANRYTAYIESVPKIEFLFHVLRRAKGIKPYSLYTGKFMYARTCPSVTGKHIDYFAQHSGDLIMKRWSPTFVQECSCALDDELHDVRNCPAFLTLFMSTIQRWTRPSPLPPSYACNFFGSFSSCARFSPWTLLD